jgi:hypothetical protein
MSLKCVYDFPEDAPGYPDGFYPLEEGIVYLGIKNQFLIEELRSIEFGEWCKVYQDGYCEGELVSIHYFESPSGRVFDLKVKSGWSTQ